MQTHQVLERNNYHISLHDQFHVTLPNSVFSPLCIHSTVNIHSHWPTCLCFAIPGIWKSISFKSMAQ